MPASSSALATLLSHPAIWRGDDCAPEPAAVPSGFAALDAALPGRGWPQGALTELLLEREGIGEIRLTLPALAHVQAQQRDVVWIAPPHRPYAPALAAAGLDLARFFIVHCKAPKDALWAFEQALRAPECGAAFAWLSTHDERALRRLQVAARDGRMGRAVAAARPARQRHRHTVAPRAVAPGRTQRCACERRGSELMRPVLLDASDHISTGIRCPALRITSSRWPPTIDAVVQPSPCSPRARNFRRKISSPRTGFFPSSNRRSITS
jgi:hypothetical protein